MRNGKQLADYVNPYIGSIGHLLTSTDPTVMLPHGMMRINPAVDPFMKDRYFADKIHGYMVGSVLVMPAAGNLPEDVTAWHSDYDHDLEISRPYSYKTSLLSHNVDIKFSITDHSAIFSFAAEENDLKLMLQPAKNAEYKLISKNEIHITNIKNGLKTYIVFKFDLDCKSYSTWNTDLYFKDRKGNERGNTVIELDFAASSVNMRCAISYIDLMQADENLEKEIPDFNIDEIESKAKDKWNSLLGKIEVKGGTEDQKTIFYTAMYRAFSRMNNYTEYGRYYSGYNNKVNEVKKHDFYCDDGIWDTYRCMHPIQLLLEPKRQEAIVQSYVTMFEQSGWLPSFPFLGGDKPVMLGFHATATIVDAYIKGLTDFDIETAYLGMKKNAMEKTMIPWCNEKSTELDRCYYENGFFPALDTDETEWVDQVHSFERRQSVAVTMEHAYDDWCLAILAKRLGKTEDSEYFFKRSKNYQNLYNKEIGFVAPKNKDGEWVSPYNPKWCGGQGGREYFAENNAYVYNFHVQHDIAGLQKLMGGTENFESKLDNLFTEQYDGAIKSKFLDQYPDSTGLMGQYPQGNEPSFHIPYLYNYTGSPWKTQRIVREIMKLWYTNSPYGICGDEDGGAMSSWYVFSAMGFYPTCPGRPLYDLGSPIFDEITIHLDNGSDFTIKAEGADENKYIQSAYMNGEELQSPFISHKDIIKGGKLVLNLDKKPNFGWGVAENTFSCVENDI